MEKGSSSSSSSSDGLKFGKKIYFEGVGSGVAAPAPPSPAKKGRSAAAQGGQPPRCQVEGCKVDLSDAKAYYCRHKVCGVHSKSSKVIVAGIEQRFCQQCSRFHQLPEFDQGKRSCRRRLAGHNERRRKPPAGPLLSPRYQNLSPSTFDNHGKTGGFVMDFSGYSTVPGRESWPNTTCEQGLANQATITKNYELSWPSNPQNPLPNLLEGSTARPNYSRPEITPQNGALSLLSNQSWGSRTQQQQQASSLGVNNFFGPHGSDMVQPSVDPGGSIGQFSSWGFKGNQGGSSMHEMGNDMGLAAISQSANNGQFSRDFGLAQPSVGQYHDEIEPSRGFDSQVHHMHWSL